MIVDHLGPHGVEQLVKALGGEALEKGVGVPLVAHAVHHLAVVVAVGIHHGVHGVDVILAVAVDGDGDVAFVPRLHQPGQNGVLMAPVAALADAKIMGVAFGQIADNLPGAVFGTVVHKEHAAVRADFAGVRQIGDFFQEHFAGDGQDFLLVVAGYDNVKDRLLPGCVHRISTPLLGRFNTV